MKKNKKLARGTAILGLMAVCGGIGVATSNPAMAAKTSKTSNVLSVSQAAPNVTSEDTGPVLPTYPAWSKTKWYSPGDRVSYKGKNYEAWIWNRNTAPGTGFLQPWYVFSQAAV